MILEKLRTEPVSGAELEARAKLAEGYQRAWGCPSKGYTPPKVLRVDLADEARYYAETLGMVPLGRKGCAPAPLPRSCTTCPFSALARAPMRVREVLRFARLSREFKGALTPVQVLGRELSLWDIGALDALVCTESEVSASNDAVHEAERKAKAGKPA